MTKQEYNKNRRILDKLEYKYLDMMPKISQGERDEF